MVFSESPSSGSGTAFEDADQALLEGAVGGVWPDVDSGSVGGGDAGDRGGSRA